MQCYFYALPNITGAKGTQISSWGGVIFYNLWRVEVAQG